MISFDKYERLSEDAQRLLCFQVQVGMGQDKRMDEVIYVLGHYCFATFDGTVALEELVTSGMLAEEGRDWTKRTPRYGVNADDVVPALWYLHACRQDLAAQYRKHEPASENAYTQVRLAVRELVDTDYRVCEQAGKLSREVVHLFLNLLTEPRFEPLFAHLPSESFVELFSLFCNHFTSRDMVVDTALATRVVGEYQSITEATRCQILAEIELYDYIASGKVPAGGIYENISAGYSLGALRNLCAGRLTEAVSWFEQALKIQQRDNGARGYFQNGLLCFFLATAYMAKVAHTGEEQSEENERERRRAEVCQSKLRELVANMEVRKDETLLPARVIAEDACSISEVLHKEQVMRMYEESLSGERTEVYRPLSFLLANYLGYSTAQMDVELCMPRLAILQHEMMPYIPLYDDERESLKRHFGGTPVLASIPHKTEWESVLENLIDEASGNTREAEVQDIRLMYLRESPESALIQVREQTKLKNGAWGNGKRLNDTRYRKGDVPYMNNADRRILARLNHSDHWELRLEDVIEEMVDESRLYVGGSTPYSLVRVDRDIPYLMVEREDDRFVVKSNVPQGKASEGFVVVEDSATHYSVIEIPEDIRGYYVKLLQLGSLPLEAEPTLRSLLEKIGGKVELHSPLIEGGSTLPLVDGEWSVGFRLSPKQGGNWEVEALVRPLPGGRKTFPLGRGERVVIDENEQGRMRVRRNMEMERQNLDLVAAFWRDEGYDGHLDHYEGESYPPEFMLDLVEMIQRHPDTFYAEWPEGQGFRIRPLSRGASSFSGVLKQRGQWFDIEGDIDIDEDTRISIGELLELVGKSKGKYVQIGEGDFLTLSEKLKSQLKALDAIANREHGKIKISPFSAAMMGENILHGELHLKMDEKLDEIRQRILDSSHYTPPVPEGLNASLRPYQREGYHWIARLNKWGAGALLADDMGLGKTVQAITFFLLKKEEGASLVVAPASVVPNWKEEIERFAPELNVQILNFSANRKQTIEEAKAGDVIVVSYGILLSIQEDITRKQWNVACLDEAHIIKNRGAKTSGAAMKIQARNRVMLTGTPVQNHLGELWSLFQFVNPGMLGTYEHFSQKFIIPIEGHQDREKQEQLERIVHPFMLRRTKQAVLKELPEKTEIYQTVEMSREEIAIYESIRTRAEKMLQSAGGEVNMHVLAEITRLRQAACSAQLIEPKWTGECSKVTALVELLQGVTEGGNRALVFSQFVGFFDIVRRKLDELGMRYFYIDGSVPLKQRSEMVQAFQNGENALFLISLKAGGLGLNLTGANYVFHLDPWWNPAIEQQATDRAYRIGQQQAVTAYHLVSKNTIEEKIIRLHQTKRNLAENILAGTDGSYKLSGKDLLEMVAR